MKIIAWVKYCFVIAFTLISLTSYAAKTTSPISSDVKAVQTSAQPSLIPAPPTLDAKAFILMDANTGLILAGNNYETPLPPASLTKLMTLYEIASALKSNRLHLNDAVNISEKAWRTGGSKMFVKLGDHVPVSALIQGIAVASGNDACVAIAEHIAGTEESFADLMNKSAQQLGMKNTHYTDSTGLPNPQHYTTAFDLAILTRAIVSQFPEYYNWYSQKWFEYNGIKQPNRDLLLWRDPSIEGMKTGHTDAAGYCLVSTASRKGMRLIAVVMGAPSIKARAAGSLALLNYGFHFYESKKILAANTPVKQQRIWYGKNKYLPIGVTSDFYVTLPTGQIDKVKSNITTNKHITAPITKNTPVGTVIVTIKDRQITSAPLVALEDEPKAGFFSRMLDHVISLAYGFFHKA